ncbi:hypothetical protein EP10_003354 [Geobacillus icigianus]|uniref:Uncharacterized protein n=1 Tax=Geobacillus icigianus TaxID=1430331 RepID=A0ABU6BKG7_9BACL|nr:hypothetical protein B4113_1618 [Geobacillus sp. B4113_201601]MEB3752439.1 hypothetical protein [Geobacillus icigianus]
MVCPRCRRLVIGPSVLAAFFSARKPLFTILLATFHFVLTPMEYNDTCIE